MAMTVLEAAGTFTCVARPNRSLSTLGKRWLLCGLGVLSLLVSGFFYWLGAWMVGPFAGLELLAIAWAFYAVGQSESDFESVQLAEGQLTVMSCVDREAQRLEFNPGWAHLSMVRQSSPDPLLRFESHGRSVTIGRLMTVEQRASLAKQLLGRLPHVDMS